MKNKGLMVAGLFILILGFLAYYATRQWKAKICENTRLQEQLTIARDSLQILKRQKDSLSDVLFDEQLFSLSYNDEAMDYLDKYYPKQKDWNAFIVDKLMETNLQKGDNPLIPYAGMYGPLKIYKARVLNHKWLIASFTDGRAWGEALMEYEPVGKDSVRFETVKAVLYPL